MRRRPGALLAALLLLAGAAGAQEIRFGLLWHDVAPLWGNNRIEKGVDLNAEYIFGKRAFRPVAGISINSQGQASRGYFGIVAGTRSMGMFFDLGLGAAIQINAVRELGSPVLFRVAGELGYRWGRHGIAVFFAHISNANLAPHNAGLDVLGIRYGHRRST